MNTHGRFMTDTSNVGGLIKRAAKICRSSMQRIMSWEIYARSENLQDGMLPNCPHISPLARKKRRHAQVGESFLQMGRSASEKGPQVPSTHHTTITTEGAALLEARYAIKHPESCHELPQPAP